MGGGMWWGKRDLGEVEGENGGLEGAWKLGRYEHCWWIRSCSYIVMCGNYNGCRDISRLDTHHQPIRLQHLLQLRHNNNMCEWVLLNRGRKESGARGWMRLRLGNRDGRMENGRVGKWVCLSLGAKGRWKEGDPGMAIREITKMNVMCSGGARILKSGFQNIIFVGAKF